MAEPQTFSPAATAVLAAGQGHNQTHKQRLLKALNNGAKITPLDSWRVMGIYRLASRICELRQDGHNIQGRRKQVVNRFGEQTYVMQYYIEQGK